MSTGKPNGARTIEDIERRQREVRALEVDAMDVLVRVLRDIAVALPVESKLPYDLADCAKRLEQDLERAGGENFKPHVVTYNALSDMRHEISDEIARWVPEGES